MAPACVTVVIWVLTCGCGQVDDEIDHSVLQPVENKLMSARDTALRVSLRWANDESS